MKKIVKALCGIILLFLLTPSISSAKSELLTSSQKNIEPKNIDNEYYKISAGDKLKIVVYEEIDLSGDFEVKEDGTITFPLLGPIKVVNLTKKEMEDKQP